MTRNILLITALSLKVSLLLSQELNIAPKLDSVYDYGIGEKMFTVELTALKEITIPDLETAFLQFKLHREERIYSPPYVYDSYARGGPGRTILQPGPSGSGTEEYIFVETPQNFIELKKGQSIKKFLDMTEIFDRGLPPGKYSLLVSYENGLEVESNFRVHVSYKKVIPEIIQGVSNNIVRDGKSLLREFYYLLGYPTDFFESGDSPPDSLHYKQVPILRVWWEEHSELIFKIESVLNTEEYKGMLYEDRVPNLLKKLEKGEYQERLEAKNELYEILGLPKWKPSVSDTEEEIQTQIKELSIWWEENKELINWVNQVILENQL